MDSIQEFFGIGRRAGIIVKHRAGLTGVNGPGHQPLRPPGGSNPPIRPKRVMQTMALFKMLPADARSPRERRLPASGSKQHDFAPSRPARAQAIVATLTRAQKLVPTDAEFFVRHGLTNSVAKSCSCAQRFPAGLGATVLGHYRRVVIAVGIGPRAGGCCLVRVFCRARVSTGAVCLNRRARQAYLTPERGC